MSTKDFKKWMEVNDKTVIDIASILKISPQTVSRYLRGERVNRSTQGLIEGLVKQQMPLKAAAG